MSPEPGSPESEIQGQPEIKPVKIIDVSPIVLANFLKGETNLEFGQKPDYPGIFQGIRVLPFETQESLLVEFFTKRVEDFPNNESLGKFLAWINNIAWVEPPEIPKHALLRELSNEHFFRLNSEPPPTRVIQDETAAAEMVLKALTQKETVPIDEIKSMVERVKAEYESGREDWQSSLGPELKKFMEIAITRARTEYGLGEDWWWHLGLEEVEVRKNRARLWGTAAMEYRDMAIIAYRSLQNGEGWMAALEAASEAVNNAAKDNPTRTAAAEMAENIAEAAVKPVIKSRVTAVSKFMAENAAGSLVEYVKKAARGIIVQDLMPQRGYGTGDPLEPLLRICYLGCWPIGVVGQEFVIFIPPHSQKAA